MRDDRPRNSQQQQDCSFYASNSQGLQLNIKSQSSFCKKCFYLKPPISQQKRYLEMRKNGRMEKACRSIPEISLKVDRLAIRVCMLFSMIFSHSL
ncbi:unnamed protein product [Linum trigynum]|uniref:Uncharacterized protein n=1 Tax=Linum trigynum TaxID=586398 RepID=A0AAV2F606_9ROSI